MRITNISVESFVERKRFPEVKWANPFTRVPGKTGDQVMDEYENYIRKKIIEDNLIEELLGLEGKNSVGALQIVVMEMCC